MPSFPRCAFSANFALNFSLFGHFAVDDAESELEQAGIPLPDQVVFTLLFIFCHVFYLGNHHSNQGVVCTFLAQKRCFSALN